MYLFKKFGFLAVLIPLTMGFFGCALNSYQVGELSPDRAASSDDLDTQMAYMSKYPDAARAVKEAKRHCEISSLSWQKGDLDGALAELDKAYSILLSVDPKKYPELSQTLEDLRYTIAKRILQVQALRSKGTKGIASPIPMVMNRHVKEALDNFQGPLRDFFMRSYNRSLKYRPMIVNKLKAAGLPEELSWLPLIESGFNVRAFSPARALGMWQFIASTGHRYGLKRDDWVDERMDPEKSTDAAILYLKELHGLFGDWTTALAAYNCGEGNVLRVIRTQQIDYLDNFWDLYERLPKETAFYVPQFIAVLHIVASPKDYNFDLPEYASALEYETIDLNKSISLSSLESASGLEEGLLSSLNPELRRYITPPYPYQLKVPKGKREIVLAAVDSVDECSDRQVYAKNGNRKNGKDAGKQSAGIANKGGGENSKQQNTLSTSSGYSKDVPFQYTVQKGDTIQSIAKKYGVTVESIKKANNLKKTNLLLGQSLLIPMERSDTGKTKAQNIPQPPKDNRSAPTKIKYTVKKGDSLYSISKRFGMNMAEIMELNNLRDGKIYPGQILTLRDKS